MTIAIVRSIIPDKAQYDRAGAIGDGGTLEFQLANYPVIDGSQHVYINSGTVVEGVNYTINNDLGLVTFMVAPVLGAIITVTYQHTLLSDDDITAFIALEGSDMLAAALGLETIAANEALVQKAITLLDVTTDGPALCNALLARAKQIRANVAAALASAAAIDVSCDWAEQTLNEFAYREIINNDAMRSP